MQDERRVAILRASLAQQGEARGEGRAGRRAAPRRAAGAPR
jgi:hypothetical protein